MATPGDKSDGAESTCIAEMVVPGPGESLEEEMAANQ